MTEPTVDRDGPLIGSDPVETADLVGIAMRMFTTTDARDWSEFIRLIHPHAEIELRSQPGRVLHGRSEMEEFARVVIGNRVAHRATVTQIEQIGNNAVAAVGRLTMTDQKGTSDIPIGWLMLFERGHAALVTARPLDRSSERDADRARARRLEGVLAKGSRVPAAALPSSLLGEAQTRRDRILGAEAEAEARAHSHPRDQRVNVCSSS